METWTTMHIASARSSSSIQPKEPTVPSPPTTPIPMKNMARMGRDSFTFHKIIGTGTFGDVVLATFEEYGRKKTKIRPCALKILQKKTVVKLKQVEHAVNEVFILRRCAHPFIVNLMSLFKDNSRLYIALEYVPGGELFRKLRMSVKFSEHHASFYAAQILLALEYLHFNSIVYRDIKPENILFKRNGYIKLVDFGFAKIIRNTSHRTYTLCGTPEYLAPEILIMKGYGISVDYWAFGILLFEMCAGYPPFQAESPMKTYKKIVTGKYKAPSSFSPQLQNILTKLLTVQPHLRLGVIYGDCQRIKDHTYFHNMDWMALLDEALPAPYKPKIKSSLDHSHFCEYEDVTLDVPDSKEEEFPDLFHEFGLQQ
eukprot:m.54343 g.54343  ORF g.54343 m.54343 type:complete len:369 (+) comp7715_c0_seq1:506-1612(+)